MSKTSGSTPHRVPGPPYKHMCLFGSMLHSFDESKVGITTLPVTPNSLNVFNAVPGKTKQ